MGVINEGEVAKGSWWGTSAKYFVDSSSREASSSTNEGRTLDIANWGVTGGRLKAVSAKSLYTISQAKAHRNKLLDMVQKPQNRVSNW